MTQDTWSARVAKAVATEVRRHRRAQGLSAQQLADRCAAFGYAIGRSVLANFESGRRPTVSVPDLLVLAKALGVPPAALVFAPGREETAEVLPGRMAPAWDAMKWFAGEQPLSDEDAAEWDADYAGLSAYRRHQDIVDGWLADHERAAAAREAVGRAATDAEAAALSREADLGEQLAEVRLAPLRTVRQQLRERGLRLPELPEELQRVDAEDYQPDWGRRR